MEVLERVERKKTQFGKDILEGLSPKNKVISSKYFYDDRGSKIFQKITKHPDYYLTEAELQILQSQRKQFPKIVAEKEVDIIEIGSGDGRKSQLVINGFVEQGCKVNFYCIDISEKAHDLLKENIQPHEMLSVHTVTADYFVGLRGLQEKSQNRKVLLFLGSNIGNFDYEQSVCFLRKVGSFLNRGDYALIGFDLKKDVSRLLRAYNDSAGLTRDFNLNVFRRINHELGGNFDLTKFQHLGIYNPVLGAMESYLISTEEQDVYIEDLDRLFHFQSFEPIHLEYSFKFSQRDVEGMSDQCGFQVVRHFYDQDKLFLSSFWKVES